MRRKRQKSIKMRDEREVKKKSDLEEMKRDKG